MVEVDIEEKHKIYFRERTVELLRWLRLMTSDRLWCRRNVFQSYKSFSSPNSDHTLHG